MCGIVGAVGYDETLDYLIKGLKTLDYRGYDSAGIAIGGEKGLRIFKAEGSVEHLESIIPVGTRGNIGIGHTRWATHGKPSDRNSHPHQSMNHQITLVHNGVIENFKELKSMLASKGYQFVSDTDSEVVASLVEYHLSETNDPLKAMQMAMKEIVGSFAIVMIHEGESDRLYFMKRSSPLLIGKAEGYYLLASDASPMIPYTKKFLDIQDEQYGYVDRDWAHIFDEAGNDIKVAYTEKNPELCQRDLAGYPHFMLKEIEEIENVIRRLVLTNTDGDKFTFDPNLIKDIRESDYVIFLACGTSYHASLVGVRYFEYINKSASCYIASEWAYYPKIHGKKPFVILISQSGETADLIHCLGIVKERGLKTLVITNTQGSTLERGCNYSMLLNAGLEVSVASTKAYSAQVSAIALLVSATYGESAEIIKSDLEKCCAVISQIRSTKTKAIKKIAKEIHKAQHLFFLGRGYDYDMSREASLKLKEVSYIHSECFAGGELKHGPIALIEPGIPAVIFITDPVTASSMRNNIQEVQSRGGTPYVISTQSLSQPGDAIVVNDYPPMLSAIAISSVAFYLAYYTTLEKGYNVDKPRNLAKSVTVE